MKKVFNEGLIIGALTVILVVLIFGLIYDYAPKSICEKIWPNSTKFKTIEIHQQMFDEYIIGEIPMEYFTKTHVCEIWNGENPSIVTGIFTYDFDSDHWIYCQ